MKVAEVMTSHVVLVPAGASVQEAATLMAEHDIGALLVGSEDKPEGVLTDRDIILRLVVEGRDPIRVRVGEIMSPSLFACDPEHTLGEAFREMSERQVRRLAVLDENGRVVGIVTMSDLAMKGDLGEALEELRAISEPHRRAATVEVAAAPQEPQARTTEEAEAEQSEPARARV